MKTFDEMLRQLARPDVIEFAVASDRLPCVKIGSKYDPLDDVPRSTDAIIEMLTRIGGAPYVKDLERTPAHWTTRVDGIGSVGVQAIFVNGRLQARLALVVPEVTRVLPEPARSRPCEDQLRPRRSTSSRGRLPLRGSSSRATFTSSRADRCSCVSPGTSRPTATRSTNRPSSA